MSDHSLAIEVKCKNNPDCLFDGEDIFIEIHIVNKGDSDIGYPLEFAKERGPSVLLIDTETKKESSLSTHLADWDLKEEFTAIKPGGSVAFDWVVTDEELKQFGHKYVDLTVEVSLADAIRVKGQMVEYSGKGATRIVSRDKPKEPTPQF